MSNDRLVGGQIVDYGLICGTNHQNRAVQTCREQSNLVLAGGNLRRLLQVFFDQVGVDRKRGLRPLRRGDDDPLDGARRVAGDVETRKMGRLILAGSHRPFVVELTTETDGQFRSLELPGRLS